MGTNSDMATYNLYVYCGNNPINNIDPSGNIYAEIGGDGRAIYNPLTKTTEICSHNKNDRIIIQQKSLPTKGAPQNSSKTKYSPDGELKQKRWYGPDGNAEWDRDYSYPGTMPFPHDHDWKNGKSGTDHLPPNPAYKMNWEPVLGVGLVANSTCSS